MSGPKPGRSHPGPGDSEDSFSLYGHLRRRGDGLQRGSARAASERTGPDPQSAASCFPSGSSSRPARRGARRSAFALAVLRGFQEGRPRLPAQEGDREAGYLRRRFYERAGETKTVRILGVFPTQSRPRSPGSDRLISGPASHRSWVLQGWPGARNSRGGDAGFPQAGRLLLALTTCTTCKNYMGGHKSLRDSGFGGKVLAFLRSLSAYLRSNVSVPSVHGAKNVSVPSGKLAVFHSPTALAVPRW
jgi:hypothetical protein